MKILIVDDFSTMRRIIKNLLRDLGFTNTAEADDGNTALPMLQSGSFDFLVTDWNMPGMSGMETARAVRKMNGRMSSVPIIAVTADAMPGEREAMLASGMNEFITKPLRAEALKAVILKTLKSRAAA